MENRSHLVAAGLFVVVLTVALALTVLWLSRSSIDRSNYVVVSRIPVSGLRPDAAVRLRGVEVGKVGQIDFDPQDRRNILVGISVDRSAPLSRGTFAQLAYQGVTGLSYIALDDDGSNPQPLAPGAAQPARIELRPSLFDQLGGAGEELLREAAQSAQRLNRLLSDANLARLAGTLANTEAAARQVADLAASLQPAARSLAGLESHTDANLAQLGLLLQDLRGLSAELGRHTAMLDQVGQGAQALGESSRSVESSIVTDAVPRLTGMADELARTSRNLDRLIHAVEARPQSLVFGRAPLPPGPGEAGYAAGGRAP
jgi:phospholipid/cholesterol/gamma-HCH transport system substrate-binding protein